MTYIVKGFRTTPYGSLAKAELITSSKEEADKLLASLLSQGWRAASHVLPNEKPDDVRQRIVYNELAQMGEEFIKGTILNLRA